MLYIVCVLRRLLDMVWEGIVIQYTIKLKDFDFARLLDIAEDGFAIQ